MANRKPILKGVFLSFILALSFLARSAENEIVNEVIVLFKDNQEAVTYLKSIQTSLNETKKLSPRWPLYNLVFKDSNSAHLSLNALKKDDKVVSAQYNHTIAYRSTIPGDSFFNQQWYLHNLGFGPYPADADIDAVEAWDSTTGGVNVRGEELVVAVVDVRFNLAHEDLNFFSNIHEPRNGVDDDGNGFIDDSLGWNAYLNNDDINTTIASHATQISGIIGAVNNDTGIVGINWGIKILPVYSRAIESDVLQAFSYVIEMRRMYDLTSGTKGALIIASNTSFGVDFGRPADYPIWCAIYDSMGYAGILSAGATANSAIDVDARGDIPTSCVSPFLITVTSTNGYDNLDGNSAYGDTSIDVGAPGIGIFSTIAPNGYANGSGTSFAAPMVAGQIALMFSKACEKFWDMYDRDPVQSIEIIRSFLLSSTDPLPSLSGKTVTGGRINLYKSILELNRFSCNSCAVSPVISSIPPHCNEGNDGMAKIQILPPGSSAHILWSNGDTGVEAAGLHAGQYSWFLTDSLMCVDSGKVFINNPPPISLDSLEFRDEISSLKGYIFASAQGGTPPYSYRIDTTASFAFPNLFMGLSAGTYHVQIRDANDCTFDTLVQLQLISSSQNPSNFQNIALIMNPVGTELIIKYSSSINDEFTYKIFNMTGQTLQEGLLQLSEAQNQIQILNINGLPNGLYLLAISSGANRFAPLKFTKSE